ncbi:MAG: DNA polymerase III subunit delta [Planctomycetota bacterium]|nr:DNA polymerase III subunit delta [Planctomycetota bacterium]
MAKNGPKTIHDFLELDSLSPLTVITGRHEFDHSLALSHAKQWFRKEYGEEGEVISEDGEKAELSELLSQLSSTGFFTSAQLGIFRDFTTSGTDDAQATERWLNERPPDSYLLVCAPTLRANSAFLKHLKGKAKVFKFDEPGYKEFYARAASLVSERGLNLDPQAQDHLNRTFYRNLAGLASELDKLATWLGDRNTVRFDDLLQVCSASAAANKFALVDKLVYGDRSGALELLEKILREGEQPQVLLATLVTEYRKLYTASKMLANGASQDEAASAAKVPPSVEGISSRCYARTNNVARLPRPKS